LHYWPFLAALWLAYTENQEMMARLLCQLLSSTTFGSDWLYLYYAEKNNPREIGRFAPTGSLAVKEPFSL